MRYVTINRILQLVDRAPPGERVVIRLINHGRADVTLRRTPLSTAIDLSSLSRPLSLRGRAGPGSAGREPSRPGRRLDLHHRRHRRRPSSLRQSAAIARPSDARTAVIF